MDPGSQTTSIDLNCDRLARTSYLIPLRRTVERTERKALASPGKLFSIVRVYLNRSSKCNAGPTDYQV